MDLIPSSRNFAGGVGFFLILKDGTVIDESNPRFEQYLGEQAFPRQSRYAPEAKNAYAAYFPLKESPRRQRQQGFSFGIDGDVYFFGGGRATINGIPGGPFTTANNADTFNIKNNYMFTVGGVVGLPISQFYKVSLTGGFADLNQTVTYNCVTFCAVAPAAPAFSTSQDKWVTGVVCTP